MTVERLIKQLEKFNPKAEVRLNDSRGTTALFALSMKDKEDFVWIEGKADIDLGDEIAARFEKGINYDILKELEDIRIRMYNTNFDQDRLTAQFQNSFSGSVQRSPEIFPRLLHENSYFLRLLRNLP